MDTESHLFLIGAIRKRGNPVPINPLYKNPYGCL